MLKAGISNKIYLEGLTEGQKALLKKSLTLPNPTYQTMLRKGNMRALYGLKKDFKYYEDKDGILTVGRGMKLHIAHMAPDTKWDNNLVSPELTTPFRSNSSFCLRSYQVGVPEHVLQYKEGVVKLGTGWGKTIFSLELVRLTQLKTLIIVPRESILNQFVEEARKFFDYDIGIIQGQTTLIKDVTVASISTIQRRDVSQIADNFGMVIADEAHTMVTSDRLACIQAFRSERLYGLTATPDRSDGQSKAIFFTFGPILCDHALPTSKPSVEICNTNILIEVSDEYNEMVETQVNDFERNTLISNIIASEYSKGRKILVLTKRLAHFETIESMLCTICPQAVVHKISSSESIKKRNVLLGSLRDGSAEFDVILGTYSMLSTGVDIPRLDTLVFAGDVKSNVLTQQSAGRILRIFEGKKDPVIIDVVDNENPIFARQAAHRRRFYKSMGWL